MNMKITTLTVGSVRTKCYLLENSGEVGIIDPGDDGDYIIRIIEDKKLKPVWVLVTHAHFDHVLGVNDLILTYNIPLYMHPADNFLLERTKNTAEHFTGAPAQEIMVDFKPVEEGRILSVGDTTLKIFDTPGHSPGGISLYSKKNNALFCGDLIFYGGLVGKTTMGYASPEILQQSIEKMLKLPEKTIVYPGHGRPTTIENEKKLLKKTRT